MAPDRIFVSLIHYPIYTLGPGVRAGLWTQGCSIRCKGCMSQHTWAFEDTYARPLPEVAQTLLQFPTNRLTISGGEPLDQPQALYHLLKAIRHHFSDILLYTGYRMEWIEKHHKNLLNLVDAIVDSPFRLGKETHALYKGSENQRFFLLTKSLKEHYEPWVTATKTKQLQLVNKPDGIYIIGIPYQGDLEALQYEVGQNL